MAKHPITILTANPAAQSGSAAEWIADARALLDSYSIEHEFIATEPDGGTIPLIRDAIDNEGARCVIFMGGDGTFADVAKGILSSDFAAQVSMGMLPIGTANDQGKSFGLGVGPDALAQNVAVIAAGETTLMDVGHIEALNETNSVLRSDLFFDSASIGWGAGVLITRNRDRQTVEEIPIVRSLYRDHLVYAGAMLKHMVKTYTHDMNFELVATINGQEHRYEGLIDVIIKNTHIFGGEWVLAPDGASDDGKFEIVPIAGRGEYISKFIAAHRQSPIDEDDLRSLGIELSRPLAGSKFELQVIRPSGKEKPLPVQVDGEEWMRHDRFRIQVLPRILRLIVPRQPT